MDDPGASGAPPPPPDLEQRAEAAARRALAAVLAWPDRTFIVVLFTATYVVASFGLNTVYPFSVFEMYAETSSTGSASRVLVREGTGALREVTQYRRWRCSPMPSFDPQLCRVAPFYLIPYVDRERRDWIVRHPASPADALRPVTVIRRVWRFEEAGPVAHVDCVMGACEAAP